MKILTKNDIIEIQRHCYAPLEDITVLQDGVEVTLKVGSMISDASYFDIHKFASDIEAFILARLEKSECNPESPASATTAEQ